MAVAVAPSLALEPPQEDLLLIAYLVPAPKNVLPHPFIYPSGTTSVPSNFSPAQVCDMEIEQGRGQSSIPETKAHCQARSHCVQ